MSVTLRKRKKGKKISLYLDYYEDNKRSYEYLKLYLTPTPLKGSLTAEQKQVNEKNLKVAEAIRYQRENETFNGKHGLPNTQKLKGSVIKYFELLIEKRKTTKDNFQNWESTLLHLKRFCPNDITFSMVSKKWVEDVKEYLKNVAKKKNGEPLSPNSAASYFNKFRAGIKQAYEDEILVTNHAEKVPPLKGEEVEMLYLEESEVQRMADAHCQLPILKRAFLFACVTGLRWSDIEKLLWSELHITDNTCEFHFRMKKNQYKFLKHPFKVDYIELLGQKGEPDEKVFFGVKYEQTRGKKFDAWLTNAGIEKEITFHSARHTFACILLNKGESIYVVSQMLGHKNINTTIKTYAHIWNETKVNAANKINVKL